MAHTYTWQKLANNAYRMNPKSRGPRYPYTPRFEYSSFTSGENRGQKVIVPYKATNTLLISLRAWGVTQSALHNVTMLFSDVEILTENPNSPAYFQLKYKDTMYWIKKLDKTKNPLTSRCSCADEFFTWALWKHQAGCLYGQKPRPYKRKTMTRPPRNPAHIVGICKHVFNAWTYLKNSGMTVN